MTIEPLAVLARLAPRGSETDGFAFGTSSPKGGRFASCRIAGRPVERLVRVVRLLNLEL